MSRRAWNEQELLAVYDEEMARGGRVNERLAQRFNCTEAAVRSKLNRLRKTLSTPVKAAPAIALPDDPQYAQLARLLHPQPYAVTFPKIATPVADDDMITGILAGDSHGQFIDERAEACMLAIAEEVQPQIFVHMGDAVDCYTISAFDKDLMRKETFQDEIDHARQHLARIRTVVPNAALYLLEGNHEERLRRQIFKSDGAMREIAKLRAFQDAINWPNLLQLDALGIEWVPTRAQSRHGIFPKFITKHGTVVRKWSGWSAKGEWETFGKSGASGHTHRLAVFMHRDHNGSHVWLETGCLCTLQPEYKTDPDWQQGFFVVTFEAKTGAFQVEKVYIHNGTAVWRGKRYKA